MAEPRVTCRTPTPGRSGTTAIPAWKFDAVRDAILAVLTDGPVLFKDLTGQVRQHLGADERDRLGSVGWHVATVKLEMEVRGEIARLDGKKPQQLKRVE